jgi:PBP1b-binding outer membrane lipoprotein LpoB
MTKVSAIAFSLLVLVALAGCGGNAPGANNTPATNNPQATSAPTLASSEPTLTEVPTTAPAATNTPEPTAAPTDTTAAVGNLPQDLANAVNKTRDVLALRYEISSNLTLTQNGKLVTSQFTVKAEGNGTDSHSSVTANSAFTGQSGSYEYIKSGGQTYIKGIALGKADPNVWYVFPAVQGSALTQSTQNPKGLLSGLKADDFKPGNFQPSGIEIVDLLPCEVWTAQTPGPLTHFIQTTGSADRDREFKAIDKYDGRLWTCADGYLHQGKLHLEGHDSAKVTDKASFDLSLRIYDFNATITISPPANAQPFPTK